MGAVKVGLVGKRRQILIVDDNDLLRSATARSLAAAGYHPLEARSKDDALSLVSTHPRLERAVIDLRLQNESGLDVLRALLEVRPSMRCVMFSGYCSTVVAVEAVRAGALNCLPKSTTIPALLDELESDSPGRVHEIDVPSLAQVEWDHIQRVLHDCEGNVSLAARKLGLHRQSLQRKLRRFAPSR